MAMTDQRPLDAKSTNTATSTVNADVSITLAATAGKRHRIRDVVYSYTGGTVTGRLQITDGGVSVFDVDITATGQDVIGVGHLRFAVNSQVNVTLKAGGSGVVGKVNVYSTAVKAEP